MNSKNGGVGFLIRNDIAERIVEIKTTNSFLLTITLNDFDGSLLVLHTFYGGQEKDSHIKEGKVGQKNTGREAERRWDILQETCWKYKNMKEEKKLTQVIMKDANAKIGIEDLAIGAEEGSTGEKGKGEEIGEIGSNLYHETSSKNGTRMLQWLNSCGFTALNTMRKKKRELRYTFMGYGWKSQIDFTSVEKNDLSFWGDCGTLFETPMLKGASEFNGHYPVYANIEAKKKEKQEEKKKKTMRTR